MTRWTDLFDYDPVIPLITSANTAVNFMAHRHLLGEIKPVPEFPEGQKIAQKQTPDGAWKYSGGNKEVRSTANYNQIETFRNVGYLIECYGYTVQNPLISKAANFLFSFQTPEGDIRGILGNQYSPYYTAAILELLLKAGLTEDARIDKAMRWLLSMLQEDGGWAIPLRTQGKKLDIISMNAPTLRPLRYKPSSYMVTGIVLRAFAAHPKYSQLPEVKHAAKLLLYGLFLRDKYTDRGNPQYWLRFTYPFWFTDLISATDTLSSLRITAQDPQMKKAIEWFLANQSDDGLWHLKTLKNKALFQTELWLSLAICRIVKRLYVQ